MNNNKKHVGLSFGVSVGLCFSVFLSSAYADDPLNLQKQVDISFGTIDFEGSTGIGNITLGSNGNVSYGSNTSGAGIGTPAQMLISGPVGTVVSISCNNTASLALGGQSPLQVVGIRFTIGSSNVAPYAMGTACSGIGSGVTSHTISATPAENIVVIGGVLELNGRPLANGTYSTANGGSLPSFQLLVQ